MEPSFVNDDVALSAPVYPDLDAPVLVAVLREPADLDRARSGWYRIPLAAPARRLAADYIAFYQTGAFPPEQRWSVRYYAPVCSYHIVTRRELIPGEPDHPRAGVRYYRIDLGPLQALPRPVPSRRLRRITFIHTDLEHLLAAREINDLWLKTPAQQKLWDILAEARLEAEFSYPLVDDMPEAFSLTPPVADIAVLCREGRIALLLHGDADRTGVAEPRDLAYLLARGNWQRIAFSAPEILACPPDLSRLMELVTRLGGRAPCT